MIRSKSGVVVRENRNTSWGSSKTWQRKKRVWDGWSNQTPSVMLFVVHARNCCKSAVESGFGFGKRVNSLWKRLSRIVRWIWLLPSFTKIAGDLPYNRTTALFLQERGSRAMYMSGTMDWAGGASGSNKNVLSL